LEYVKAGEEILITEDGVAIARIVPVDENLSKEIECRMDGEC
jgi:antitoxin (DNA-binding transcriptional repressor) of toxin-antitoxin stability system